MARVVQQLGYVIGLPTFAFEYTVVTRAALARSHGADTL